MPANTFYIFAYVAILLIGRFVSQSQRKAGRLPAQARSILKDPTAIFMALSAVVAITLPLVEVSLRETVSLGLFSVIIGVAFLVLGWGVAYSANRVIAENWSPAIAKTGEQDLVTSGVYSVVRHPLYFSGLLILLGTNIYFESTWAWLGVLLTFVITVYRIPLEERRLEERFGQEFIDYKRRTKAFIPWLL
jgi:protein-S-isoprenylcysteine O-methyltransferase Ste14